MLKEKINILKNNKQQTKTVVLALLMVTMILLMDVTHLFVVSDPNDEYTFFYDDFMFTTTNSTALWRGNYHISAGKLAVDEGQISWADFNIGAWNGYNRLILDADIVPDSSSQSARILVRDVDSMEILYAIHPSQIYGKIDLSSYVDLTSTSLKLEIHGYCKFDKIRIYTPNLFIHNLLLDDNTEDFGIEILNGLNEQGENPAFSSYSKLLDFAPGVSAGATLETRDYFIPYLNEINLVGLVSRSYYENEECINDSIEITIQAIEYYGKSFEIHTLYSTFDMFDQQPTSFSIPLNQFVGKDIKFKLKVKVITNRLDPSYLPDLFVSYFGITAKSNSKINSRFIDAYDFATKDMFTQITPAMVSGEEKLVLARDRLGDIATYRAFLGTTTNVTYLSGYDLSEYLDTSSGTDGWLPNYGGDGLSADLSTSSEAVISLDNEQPDFTAGYLETSFDLNCYGLAAGIVFRYYSDTEFWAITVQRVEEGRDIAHLIHNGDIVKSAPLMRKLSSLVTIKIEKNCFLDYYQYSYLDYYQFSIGEQYLFKHSTSDPGTKLGLYYRIIDNTKSQQYAYPVVFRSFTLYTIGPHDVTRIYMKVQNPTSKAITLQIKEIFFTEDDYLGERIISTITVPHTEGFETIIAECINPAFNSRLILESLSEQLIYLSEFGFIGYTKFGETTPASLYYDIHENILTDHRVKENCIVIENNDEWVTYDIELKNNFVFYVYANATLNNNLVLKIYARKINTEDSFTFLDTIYFIEKDGKGYSHHFYDDLSTHEGFTEGIYEVKITVDSDISVDDPLTFWSLTATEIPDRLQGADYSDIDNTVEGWREEWDIDDGQYTYLNQQEWYTNVGFSSLNGGPMDNWALPYEYNYPEIFLNDSWNFEEDADGWDYAGVYSNIGTDDGNLDVTVSSADRYYFGAYYRTDDIPIDMINTDYNVFRINILVTEIPSGSNGIRLGVGVASDVSDFWGSDTWRYSSWTITETNIWYTFELTFDSFSADTDGTNIEYMRLQIVNSPSDSYFTANTAKFKIEEIKLLNLELESGVVDFASLELGDSWNFDEDLDSFGLGGGVSQVYDGSGYLNYSRSADGSWGNVYKDLTSVTAVDLNTYTDFSFDYKVDNLISDEIAMIRLIFYDDKVANHYQNIFIYDDIIFDGSWNTIKISLNSLTITSCEFFRIYFSNQTGTPTLFAGDTILFDNVVFGYNEKFNVEENAFYTTITSSDNLIYERFLGYSVDVKEFPFIEMKVRSNDLSICEDLNFGIHSLSYGNAYATISLSDRFEWYRLNLYQLVSSLNDNDISTLTDIFIDKILLSFNGVIDITSIKIYSIADWVYIPSDTDTIYTTAHLENSQESILKLDTDSMLAYTANVTDYDWENEVYGYWEYNLEFMLTDISEKTTLLSIFNENNQDYVLDVYIENNNIYFDDTIVTFDDTSFNLEIYRWFTLQCYSYYNYGPMGGNWNITIHIEDTYSDVLHYTSNIGEINNVPNNITLAIETTDTPVYLRNINLSLNDSVTIGTYFGAADAFYYSTDNYSIDTWYVDTNGDCYLTKINQGLGGTISSSSMFLILDQGITFKRSTLGIEFMSPEDFYIYLQSLCYGESFHIYVNDYDINANGVNDDTIYELNKFDVGTIVDTITLTTNNDYGYISKLHIWGNYSWGDFYTNFGDGDSALNDWSFSSSYPMTISNTGDMVISDLTSFGDHRIAYYNAYFGDALISTSLNCSSASPYRDQNEYIIGYHVSVGIVFNSQSKTAYTLSSYSGYLLKYVSDIYYDGTSNSSHIYLYRYDSGTPIQLKDYSYDYLQFPMGEEDDLPLQVSTRYYDNQLTIGVYFNNTYLGQSQYTSNIYESGYIGVYAEVLDDYDIWYDNVQSGAVTEFSIMHKYYYPESDNVNYNTDSEENFFAGGRLYVAGEDVEINDLGNFDDQKNIIITFEFPQLKPSCFIGFIYDKEGTPKYYGYLFRSVYWEVASEIWLLDGTTTLDSTGGTLINTNWLSENFGRTLYFVSTLHELRNTGEPYERAIDIDIQLFSEKEFRPDTNHPLNNMVSIVYLSYTMDPPYGEEPIFSIKTVLDKNNLIIHNIELGGVYPIDKEWLDESVSHGIRGAGEIADYYLQAKGQGSIKIDTSISAVWMERPFYVPEQTDSTSISFTYLSSATHYEEYVLLIYKDSTEFMKVEISTTNNSYEQITTSVKNGENYIVQTTHYVPYYQWITFSVEFSTTLELITSVSYNNKNLQEEGVIYAYLTVNTYYTFKLSKDIDSSGDTGNLYLASLALQNGAGFSSTFVNGDMNGWQLSDSSKFIYSTEVSLNPDSLTLYAEPFGGWCDITISVDDGEYIRTTRIEVEDEETFKPYLLRLPEEVDTTEIHKYTIIADGILTIYSIGFFQSIAINSWLITKPYINDEIKEEVTSIGNTVVDFEDSNYSHEGTTSTNDVLLGSVGILNNATEFDDDYLGISNPMTWNGNMGFWLKWDKDGTDVPFIRLGVVVINDYGDTPVNQLFDVYIHLRESSGTNKDCLIYSHILYDANYDIETGYKHAESIHYNFYSDTNQWQYMYLDVSSLVAYYKTKDTYGEERYNYIHGGFNFLEFDTESPSSTIYLDDITLYEPDVKQPGIFARSYTYANGFNTQSVWVPQQVNSLGYIDFNSLDISGASLNEQSSFVIQCNSGADAQLHISSSRPFLLYQGNTLIHTNYVLPDTISDTYLDIHLYEGINRFTFRSISHTLLDMPWILKADILAPTNVEIVSEEYQSRKLSELNNSWFIDDWLVSDRPIYWESLDKYEIPQVGEDEYYEMLYDKIDDFKMQELTVMLPYAGEQFNFTVPTNYDVDVTEWVSFNYAYPNEDTGLVNYISGGMNNTNVDANDQIVYYTNLHFLDTYPNNQQLNLTYWGDIETIYYDSVYVYGKAGKTKHNGGTDVATESLGVNGTKTLSIDLWDWQYTQFYNETGHTQPHAPHFLYDVNPRNPGVHRITIIMNAPDAPETVEVNSMDIKASLSYLDDNVNCFTSITEYTSSKQSQQEKAAKVQLDQRSTPSDGSMSSHDKWAGKKVMESSITFDGIRYHSTRQVYVGIDNYETYEDIADPVGLGPEDAIGLLTTMVIYDAGTRHESSTIVQQAIGPNADAYENYQPTQLCIPYTMTSGIITDNFLLNTNNIRLSYSTQDTLYTSFKLQLNFNSNSLKYSQLSITNQSYYDEIISQFDSFLSSPDNEITITYSLTEPLTIQSSNETLIINTELLYITVDDLDIVFNKKLQILHVSYNDKHNVEEITIQLKSRMIMHLDPLGVHMSYKKAGSTNHGFIIYDIDKINSIGSGKLSVPLHVRLGFFSSIKNFFKKVKDAFSTIVDAIKETMKTVNDRVKNFMKTIGANIKNALHKLVDGVMVIVGFVVDGVAFLFNKIVTLVKGIVSVIKNIAVAIGQAIATFFERIFECFQAAWEWIKNAWNNVLEFCKAVIQKAKEFLKKVFDVIGKALKWLIKKIAKMFMKVNKEQEARDTTIANEANAAMNEQVKLSGVAEKAGNVCDWIKEAMMSSLVMDVLRLKLLFAFAMIFGTNVGMFETKEVVTTVGVRQFDDETAKDFSHVYQLDHVIDVLAGRQDLAGDSKFDLFDETTYHLLNPGQGDTTDEETGISFWRKFGIGLVEIEKPLSRGNWIVVKQDTDPADFDWFFGLRTRLQFGFGTYALKIPFLSEKTVIQILEVIVGILPVYNLVQDVKDMCLDPHTFFRILAGSMLIFDLGQLVGEPSSYVAKTAHTTIKATTSTIRWLVTTIFGLVKKVFWFIARMCKKLMGLKAFKIMGGTAALLGAGVAVFFAFASPTASWALLGIGIVLAAFAAAIAGIFTKGKILKASTKGSTELTENLAARVSKLGNEIAGVNLRNHEIHKSIKQKLIDFIKNKIRAVIEVSNNLKKRTVNIGRNQLPLDEYLEFFSKRKGFADLVQRILIESKGWDDTVEAYIKNNYALFLINNLNGLDDDAIKAVDNVCWMLFGTDANTFFNNIDEVDLELYRDKVKFFVENLGSDWYRAGRKTSNLIVETRLTYLHKHGSTANKIDLDEILKDATEIDPNIKTWSDLFDETNPNAREVLEEISNNIFGIRKSQKYRDAIKDMLIENTVDNWPARFAKISDPNHRLICGEYLDEVKYTKNYEPFITNTDLDQYYSAMLHEVGVYKGPFDWTGGNGESFMKAYRKLFFNPKTDVRVQLFDEWVADGTKLDVTVEKTLNGLFEKEYLEDASLKRLGGNDDILIYSYIDTTTSPPHERVYCVITDEYKAGVTSIRGLTITSIAQIEFKGFNLDSVVDTRRAFMEREISEFKLIYPDIKATNVNQQFPEIGGINYFISNYHESKNTKLGFMLQTVMEKEQALTIMESKGTVELLNTLFLFDSAPRIHSITELLQYKLIMENGNNLKWFKEVIVTFEKEGFAPIEAFIKRSDIVPVLEDGVFKWTEFSPGSGIIGTWLEEELNTLRKLLWDKLELGTFDANIKALLDPYQQYKYLQTEAFQTMLALIMDKKLIQNIHSSNMFLNFGYVMTGVLKPDTFNLILNNIYINIGFRFNRVELETMRSFRDISNSQSFMLKRKSYKNFIADAIQELKILDLSLVKKRVLASCPAEHRDVISLMFDNLYDYAYKNLDTDSRELYRFIMTSLAESIKEFPVTKKKDFSIILFYIINYIFSGSGFKYLPTDENQQDILHEEEYDYATLTDTVDMICFKDNNGDIVQINEQLVGFEFDWNDIIDTSGTSAEAHRNPFLLTDPFTLIYNDENEYMPRADLERYAQLNSADTLVGGDAIPAELIGLREEYEDYIDKWLPTLVTVNYRIFGMNLIGTNQKLNWINHIKNIKNPNTGSLSYGPHITNILFSIDINKQGLDMKNTQDELLYTRMAYNVIDHEVKVMNTQLETWIVNMLRDTDDLFSLFRKSDTITYEIIEEFFNFYKNGKVKAFYDGADPGIDHHYYPKIDPKKYRVFPVFAKVGFYEYANGTKTWGFLYEPVVIDGFGSSMEEYFSSIKNELMLKEGSELWYWVWGCPIVPR